MNDLEKSIESTRSVMIDKSLSDRYIDEGSSPNDDILCLQNNVISNFNMGRCSQLYRSSSSISLFSKPGPLDSNSITCCTFYQHPLEVNVMVHLMKLMAI